MNCMYEWIGAENSMRVIDALVVAINRNELRFVKAK